MKLLADESVDAPIVARLREDGHTVAYVAEMNPSITDDQVLDQANADRVPLMTGDKDFGELVFRLRRVTHGVILLRIIGLTPRAKAAIVSAAIRSYGHEMRDAFTVIVPGMVRIRQGI